MRLDCAEEFKPIPQRRIPGLLGTALFNARLVVDLQALTIHRFARPYFSKMAGRVLDVGCGDMPYRLSLPAGVEYKGIDVAEAVDFDMDASADITLFDGVNIPFEAEAFDHIICTEVLEHVIDPEALVAEMYRVLAPDGLLVMTMPFSARVHFAPHDFRRLTPYGLMRLFSRFRDVRIEPRGNDIAVIANKLIVVTARLLKRDRFMIVRLPALLFFGGLSLLFLALAHLSFATGFGSAMDPLGYGVTARK